jgi:hypothetical protein
MMEREMQETKVVKSTKKGDGRSVVRRSGITSPYFDLAASIAVAKIIQQQGAGTSSSQQLAHWLGYKSTNSGTYATRLSAATKHFGLIENSGDTFVITERAKIILAAVTPEDAITARIEAFLAVPLFARVYEQFRDSQFPPEVGLKNLFLNTYKILPDRVAQAVRVFLNSAEQAGFFSSNGDRSRLIKPPVKQKAQARTEWTTALDTVPSQGAMVASAQQKAGDKNRESANVDPAVTGLLRKLPMPGKPWTSAEQTRFLTAFTHIIQFLYPPEDD